MSDPGEVTRLLRQWGGGDREALDRLLPLVYDDLRRIARAHTPRGAGTPGPRTGTLVHEAYLRLAGGEGGTWEDRSHFLSVCARAMRQIAVSEARKRQAAKRGGGERPATWNEEVHGAPDRDERLLELDRALERLAARDVRLARIVECRWFAGYTEEETGEALGLSLRTVQRDWKRARAWLREDLADPEEPA